MVFDSVSTKSTGSPTAVASSRFGPLRCQCITAAKTWKNFNVQTDPSGPQVKQVTAASGQKSKVIDHLKNQEDLYRISIFDDSSRKQPDFCWKCFMMETRDAPPPRALPPNHHCEANQSESKAWSGILRAGYN